MRRWLSFAIHVLSLTLPSTALQQGDGLVRILTKHVEKEPAHEELSAIKQNVAQPTGRPRKNATAAEMTGVELNATGDLMAFLDALMANIVTIIAMFCFACFLHARYPLVYAGNALAQKQLEDERKAEGSELKPEERLVPCSLRRRKWMCLDWAWWYASKEVKIRNIIKCRGLDQAMMLQFTEDSMTILAIIGFPLVCILAPCHCFFGGHRAGNDHLSYLGMANVVDNHPWLYWAHAFTAWFVIISVQKMVFDSMRRFLRRRKAWLKELPAPRCTTILVEGIPQAYCQDDALKNFFDDIFENPNCVSKAVVVKDTLVNWNPDTPGSAVYLAQVRDDKKSYLDQVRFTKKDAQDKAAQTGTPIEAEALEKMNSDIDRAKKELMQAHEDLEAERKYVLEQGAAEWRVPDSEGGPAESRFGNIIPSAFTDGFTFDAGNDHHVEEEDDDDDIEEQEEDEEEEEEEHEEEEELAEQAEGAADDKEKTEEEKEAEKQAQLEKEAEKARKKEEAKKAREMEKEKRKQEKALERERAIAAKAAAKAEREKAAKEKSSEKRRIKNGPSVNLNRAFVTFNSRREAELAKMMAFSDDRDLFSISTPPDPSDVIYADLQVNPLAEQARELVGYALIAGVFWAYLPTVVAIAYYSSLETLRQYSPIFEGIYHNETIQPIWDGLVCSIALNLFMSFVPTFFVLIFKTFFVLKAEAWLQHKIQSWYFYFQVVFVLLVTAVGSSLIATAHELADHPGSIFYLLASTLPFASHFYLNYLPLQWVTHAQNLLRMANLGKFKTFSLIFGEEMGKQKAEPEDQDYYGIGSRSARFAFMLVLTLTFCSLSPLICILGFINFWMCRKVYGYLVVFAEARKPDLGGYFYVSQLEHVQVGMFIYIALMVGVLAARDQTVYPAGIVCAAFAYQAFTFYKFKVSLHWQSLNFTDVVSQRVEEHDAATGAEKGQIDYVQPELRPDSVDDCLSGLERALTTDLSSLR